MMAAQSVHGPYEQASKSSHLDALEYGATPPPGVGLIVKPQIGHNIGFQTRISTK